MKELIQPKLFNDKIELISIDSIIGSGYENDVAKLAIEDKIAYRAARKNMQIHSDIILIFPTLGFIDKHFLHTHNKG